MIQFPETAAGEWKIVADAANVQDDLRKRLEQDTLVANELDKLRVRHYAKEALTQELDAVDTPPVVIQTMAEYLASHSPVLVDMVEGVIKEGGVTIFLGPSGSGKSTLAVQALNSLLTGSDFLGQSVNQITGSAALLSYDQNVSIPVNWMSKMGLPMDRVLPIDLNGKGNPLNVPAERRKLAQAFRSRNVEVVMIDSFSAAFSGDQNDAGLVMAWYKEAKKFALTECGAKSLIVIIHSTKSAPDKPRGSSVHEDVADSILAIVRQPTNERKVTMEKYRAGLGQEMMGDLMVGAPDVVTHLVEIDPGAMTLAGMHLPASIAASVQFPALPTATTAPNTGPDSDGGGDDL